MHNFLNWKWHLRIHKQTRKSKEGFSRWTGTGRTQGYIEYSNTLRPVELDSAGTELAIPFSIHVPLGRRWRRQTCHPESVVELGERRADRVMGKQSAEERHREDTLNTQAHTHSPQSTDTGRTLSFHHSLLLNPFIHMQSLQMRAR